MYKQWVKRCNDRQLKKIEKNYAAYNKSAFETLKPDYRGQSQYRDNIWQLLNLSVNLQFGWVKRP